MLTDFHNTVAHVRAISPLTQTNSSTAIVSQIVDLAGYGGAEFVINYGNMTDSDVTVAVTIDEGAASNLSDASAVAAADLIGTLASAGATFADDNTVKKIGYKGAKRYIRLTLTPTGNDAGALPVCVTASLFGAKKQPV